MYPSLYDAFKDLFGLDWPGMRLVQSFGFFVAIAFLLSGWLFARELRRKQAEGLLKGSTRKELIGAKASMGELFAQFAFGFLIGWKFLSIPFADNFNADPRAYVLSGEGNLLLGILTGIISAAWRWYSANKKALPEPKEQEVAVNAADHVGNMTLVAALFGFLGAKLFHVLENIPSFLGDGGGERLQSTVFSFSGLTMYGGLILGSIAVLVYAHRNGLKVLHVMDASAPAIMLGYGVGRIGCHVSGDGDWGIVNTAQKPSWMGFLPDWFWAYDYPNNVNGVCNPWPDYDPRYAQTFCDFQETPHLVLPVFPTPFYEAITCILLAVLLWRIRKRFVVPGLFFSVYLMLNGAERFFVELIRQNEILFHIGNWGVTQAELIAFCLFVVGSIGLWWTKNRSIKS